MAGIYTEDFDKEFLIPEKVLMKHTINVLRRKLGVSVGELAEVCVVDQKHLQTVLEGKKYLTQEMQLKCFLGLAKFIAGEDELVGIPRIGLGEGMGLNG